MDLLKLKILFPNLKITENASMAEECSFRAGGRVAALIKIQDVEELKGVLRYMTEENIPHLILGNGSNTLFSDGDHDIAVIKLDEESGFFNYMRETETEDGAVMEFGAPMLLSVAAKIAADESLAGMEGLSGIPGSVGGAVFMNAGAYGYETKDVLISAHAVSSDGKEEKDFSPEEMGLGYRHSAFMENGYIVTSAVFKLKKDNKEDIKARMADFTERRVTKQPLRYPSAGSTFKRPKGYFAGKLIEDSGLKGLTVGGAQVSELHAGFVINKGGATATDILELIHLVQDVVFDKFGVRLEPEVRIIESK
ncbi:MAG: UDP-N-acetylmuramate dehydrogenase [Clostridiales bacterium]|nr:UDP-N-acetylmuramate dehydrogenase [Clostridiales bacterium]